VKRLVAGAAGAAYGLLLTWLCLYVISHMGRTRSGGAAHGCLDSQDCSAWNGVAILLAAFGPACAFTILNAVAWRRWPIRAWVARSGLATLLIIALYGALAT